MTAALGRFCERMLGWQWSAMGLHFSTFVYNTCALPVLSFVAQVAVPDDQVLRAEDWALHRPAPGPGT